MIKLYNIIFYVSRFISLSIFSICLFTVLNIKYVWLEGYTSFFYFDSNNIFFFLKDSFPYFINLFHLDIENHTKICYSLYKIFVRNCQQIDLLLVIFFLIIIINITFYKRFLKNFYKFFVLNVFLIYIIVYFLLGLPNILFLALFTPIIFLLILKLNRIYRNSKKIIFLPIIGEIFCTEKIIKHIFKQKFNEKINIGLVCISLIISNIVCFFFSYSTDKDFRNLLIKDCTYSIRHYEDKMIISGDNELIIMDNYGKFNRIVNEEFGYLEDFYLNEQKKEIYLFSDIAATFLVLDMYNFEIKRKIPLYNMLSWNSKTIGFYARFCCDNFLKKVLIVFEYFKTAFVINLENYEIIDKVNNIMMYNDGIIYNKYKRNFLISFYKKSSFLQEIDVEKCKVNNINADSHQGFIAISEKNKEIYVAFHQNGRIGVYDAETLKLKRKIKSVFMVKHITYDEDLNVLIAPSVFTGYVDIFLMNGKDILLTREFIGYELREGSFDNKKENLYVCSSKGLYKKSINIKEIILSKTR